MISLKDYAKNKNVSYEAVRKQVNRYKTELEGHIHKVNRTQYDEAVAFLDSKRTESPVILLQMDKDEEIQRLSDENKALLVHIDQIQNELIQTQKVLSAEKDSVKQLQAEKIALLEAKQEEPEKKSWWQRIWS